LKLEQLPKRDLTKYKRLFNDKQQQVFLHYLVNNYDKLRHEWAIGEQLITLEGVMQLLNTCGSLRVFWDTLILQLEREGVEGGRACKTVAYVANGNDYWTIESSIKQMGLPDTAKQLFKDLNNYYLNAVRGL